MEMRFLVAGDRGLVVELGDRIDAEINDRVRCLALALEAAKIPGLVEAVPTFRSVGIEYDPAVLALDRLQKQVQELLEALDSSKLPAPKLVELPTVYGGVHGPDLPFVSRHTGLSEAEVVRLHSETTYRVYMIGFTVGYAYMGGLPERLHVPRLASPRVKVPRGSVGIGGGQTGAYSAETPGGFHLIGRTPVRLFDPAADPPSLMQAGDSARYVPINEKEYERLERSAECRVPGAESDRSTGARGRGGAGAHDTRKPRAASRDELEQGRAEAARPPIRHSASGVPASAVFEVLEPGMLTTVQDRGRLGYMKFGVPVSGPMDQVALRLANLLVGNAQGAAALELTLVGPRLKLLADTVLALTGAEVQASLDGAPVPWYESFQAKAGQVLEVGPCRHGVRGYLAVAGGLDVPMLLRSRSTCLVAGFGGLEGRALAPGDTLAAGPVSGALEWVAGRAAPQSWRPSPATETALRVVLGPQADAFTEGGLRTFLGSIYRVSPKSDRMGCRLEGPEIEHRGAADIVSDWIPLGGIQVPGDGKPIILLADRQTTGGYTKVATVISPDVGLAAQRRPGDAIRFRAISIQDAQAASRNLEKALGRLQFLRTALWQELAESGEAPGALGLPATPPP